MKKIKRLAVVPARGGSKRVKDKNIRLLGEYPIIVHTLRTIKQSGLFSEIHVSTDSNLIIETVSEFGFRPLFKREQGLSDDYTPLMPVFKSAIEQFENINKHFDQVWLILPSAALLEPVDFIKANEFFRLHLEKPLLAVTEYPAPIEWAFIKEDNDKLTPCNPGKFSIRSQDCEQTFYDAGLFSVYSNEHIKLRQNAGSDQDFVGFQISKLKAVDLDDEEDWSILEALFQLKNRTLEQP